MMMNVCRGCCTCVHTPSSTKKAAFFSCGAAAAWRQVSVEHDDFSYTKTCAGGTAQILEQLLWQSKT
jgi:hypothetical protein